MINRIPLIPVIWQYFCFFSKLAGYKLYLLISCALITGVLQGFGVTLLIPLLTVDTPQETKKQFVVFIEKFFDFFSIEMNNSSIIITMLVVFTIQYFLIFLQNIFRVYIKSSLGRDWQKQILAAYGNLNFSYIFNKSSGYFSNLITKEVGRSVSTFSTFSMLLANIFTICIYMCFSLTLSWKITLVGFFCGLILMGTMKSIFALSRKFSRKTSEHNKVLQEYLIQTIQSYKYFKATATYGRILKKLFSTINSLVNLQVKLGIIKWTQKVVLELSATCMVLIVLYYEVVMKGNDPESILVLCLFFHRTLGEVNKFQVTWNGFSSQLGGIEVVSSSLSSINKNQEDYNGKAIQTFSENIVLSDVSFSYDSKLILKNIDLTIPKNKTIALVGQSGAGKSTMVDLFTGLIKPLKGSIKFDGVGYDKLNINDLRSMFGYVTQDIIIFDDTISENISLWDEQEDNKTDKIRHSAEMAYCSDFILENDDGFSAKIGDRGIKLSGGQRQRLAIARELYRDPEILILDEATSALDTQSEHVIKKSLEKLQQNKTIFIIAHRLSTIKHADYIYVLEKGEIIEHGNYKQLYNKADSEFRKMCSMQSLES